MSDRSDHLIERAAALLRSGKPAQPAEPAMVKPATEPPQAAELPSRPKPMRPDPLPLHVPPKFVPPPRPRPPGSLAQPERPLPKPSGSALVRSGSVTDLRALSPHAPVDLATLERAGLMVARSSRTRTTEEYRIVIGRVLRALHEEPEGEAIPLGEAAPNVVMITSARPGEGKSFTSLNLGGSIAQNAGESVLLVDVDAKQSSITEKLGLGDRPGFLDMVANPDLSPDDLIVSSELTNLSFLPLGNRSIERSEEDEEMGPEERRLTPPILALSRRFPKSLILLDAPPCLSTSDPHTLAPAVGQVVMVVEAERTQRNEVEAALELVRVCPIVTMLLNKVKMNTNHTFGSYDYFGSYT